MFSASGARLCSPWQAALWELRFFSFASCLVLIALGADQSWISNSGNPITVNGVISGAFALTKAGTGDFVFGGANTYSGGTTVSAGNLILVSAGTLGSSSNALTVNGGAVDLNATNQTIGALNGSGGLIKNSGTASTLTLGNGDGSGSYAGSISNLGTIALVKDGAGTQTLTANNSYTGATTINAGVLELANNGGVALSSTSAITVNNSGTLLMSANNQVNLATTPPITLAGGKIDAGGFSQGNSSTQIGLGAVSLTSNSIIDLTATSLLHFANSSANTWTGTVSIYNWSGTPLLGNGTEEILFGTNALSLTVAQLGQINFYSDSGSTFLGNAIFAPDLDGEIIPFMTPVPEPSTWAAAALALGAVLWTTRRRFVRQPAPARIG